MNNKEWLPVNPYDYKPSEMATITDAKIALKQGFDEGCEQTARKMVEHYSGICNNPQHRFGGGYDSGEHSRWDCPDCRQQLKKEVGIV